jgi:hypothetical protein
MDDFSIERIMARASYITCVIAAISIFFISLVTAFGSSGREAIVWLVIGSSLSGFFYLLGLISWRSRDRDD